MTHTTVSLTCSTELIRFGLHSSCCCPQQPLHHSAQIHTWNKYKNKSSNSTCACCSCTAAHNMVKAYPMGTSCRLRAIAACVQSVSSRTASRQRDHVLNVLVEVQAACSSHVDPEVAWSHYGDSSRSLQRTAGIGALCALFVQHMHHQVSLEFTDAGQRGCN